MNVFPSVALAEHSICEQGDVPMAVLFNPYYGPPGIFTIAIEPFPWASFPPLSPWEDNVVVSWNGAAELVAKSCGHDSVSAYVQSAIRCAVAIHLQEA